jgi:hypothetical protein
MNLPAGAPVKRFEPVRTAQPPPGIVPPLPRGPLREQDRPLAWSLPWPSRCLLAGVWSGYPPRARLAFGAGCLRNWIHARREIPTRADNKNHRLEN